MWVNSWPNHAQGRAEWLSLFVQTRCPWAVCHCQGWEFSDLVSPPYSSDHCVIRTRRDLQIHLAGTRLKEQIAGTPLKLEGNFQIFVRFFHLGHPLFYFFVCFLFIYYTHPPILMKSVFILNFGIQFRYAEAISVLYFRNNRSTYTWNNHFYFTR